MLSRRLTGTQNPDSVKQVVGTWLGDDIFESVHRPVDIPINLNADYEKRDAVVGAFKVRDLLIPSTPSLLTATSTLGTLMVCYQLRYAHGH